MNTELAPDNHCEFSTMEEYFDGKPTKTDEEEKFEWKFANCSNSG